jgi:hypothetical protein
MPVRKQDATARIIPITMMIIGNFMLLFFIFFPFFESLFFYKDEGLSLMLTSETAKSS